MVRWQLWELARSFEKLRSLFLAWYALDVARTRHGQRAGRGCMRAWREATQSQRDALARMDRSIRFLRHQRERRALRCVQELVATRRATLWLVQRALKAALLRSLRSTLNTWLGSWVTRIQPEALAGMTS